MWGYTLRRIAMIFPVLFIVSVVVFSIIHLAPGDPASQILGQEATEEQIQALREALGLNEPLLNQYVYWVWGIVRGDWGVSYFTGEPVLQAIGSHFLPTLLLSTLAETIAVMVAVPFGVMAAARHGRWVDTMVMVISMIGMSVPAFLLGILLMLIFAVELNLLPHAGYIPLYQDFWDGMRYMILPTIALASMQIALIARMTRSSMLEVLNAQYIRTSMASGIARRKVIFKYALRNALLPILTVIGQTFGLLLAGAVVTETIFNIPGLGQIVVNSIKRRDYPMIQGVVLFITIIFVFINLLIDILYSRIDPRVRLDDH